MDSQSIIPVAVGGHQQEGQERCAFFVKKKGRNCRMLAAKGSIYCAEHMNHQLDPSGVSDKCRIPCPLDPKHTVFEHSLEKHLRKCNAKKVSTPACYSANINTGMVGYFPSPEEMLPLSAFSKDRVQQLIAMVDMAWSEYAYSVEEAILSHPAMETEIANPINGPTALKHLKQQASILGHLEQLKLLTPRTCFIEFGAGRAKLSHCVEKALCGHGDSVQYVLVDRANCRRKMDMYHKGDHGPKFQRLLIDIEHLDLGKLECLGSVDHTVGISKHLCGAATDLTLRCLVETLPHCTSEHKEGGDINSDQSSAFPQVSASKEIQTSHKLAGTVIALCCHHRCNWTNFVGRDFFTALGMSAVDFHLVCHMSSWAVCGQRPPRDPEACQRAPRDPEACQRPPRDPEACQRPPRDPEACQRAPRDPEACQVESDAYYGDPSSRDVSSDVHDTNPEAEHSVLYGYIPHPKEGIGQKCKRLIDYARLHYLKKHGFKTKLVSFVERTTSLENVLMIAIPQ